jgi:small-conductance mechanosensitive channel
VLFPPAGIVILVLRPYQAGEYVDGERVEGIIESVSVFHTVVVTTEGVSAAIPNAAMWSRSILNLSRHRPGEAIRTEIAAMGITVDRISHPDIRKRRRAKKKSDTPEAPPEASIV